jgi:hypothetical protein
MRNGKADQHDQDGKDVGRPYAGCHGLGRRFVAALPSSPSKS